MDCWENIVDDCVVNDRIINDLCEKYKLDFDIVSFLSDYGKLLILLII